MFAACPGLSGCFLNDEISMARGDIRVIGEVGFGRLEWYLSGNPTSQPYTRRQFADGFSK